MLSRRNGFFDASFFNKMLSREENGFSALMSWAWFSHRNYRIKKNNAESWRDGSVFKKVWCS